MRKCILLIFLLGAFLTPLILEASIYGSIRGKVVDKDGNPVVGATVFIEGTKLGAYVQPDGSFNIMKISPGTYKVRVSAVSYATTYKQVSISADITADVNVTLSSSEVATDTIQVVADRQMVENNSVGVVNKFDASQLQSVAREGVQAIVGLSAGVYNSGNGWNIRGSRTSDTQIRVDGLDVGNQFTGGFGISGMTYYPMVSTFATEEVQVLTSSFSAEYGDAMGGVVNTIVKTGKTDRYEGFLRYRHDLDALWGSQDNGLVLVREGERLKALQQGDGKKLQGPNMHKVEGGVGGPLPLLDGSTFFISSSYMYEQFRGNSYEIYDPIGNNLGQLPNQQSWIKNITGRMRFSVSQDIDFIVGGNFGMTNLEVMSSSWLYNTDKGAIEGLYSYGQPEYAAQQAVANQLVGNFMVRVNHILNQNSFYEFTISNTTNNDYYSKRKSFDDPSYFGGFELWYPQDDWNYAGSTLEPGQDFIVDPYTPVQQRIVYEDGYREGEVLSINPLTGFIEGGESNNGSQDPYGATVGFFPVHGNQRNFSFRKGNYWQIDGNYNLMINGDFDHMIKAGFEVRLYDNARHYNSLPWDSNPFFDVYTSEWGGNLYTDSEEVDKLTSQSYKPIRASAYIQDQIIYKGIILNPGIRFDYFDPASTTRIPSGKFVKISEQEFFEDASAKYQISPRLQITYPITERSNIAISYGLYFKMPELQYLYDAFAVENLRGNQILGDPNIEAQRTNQYNLSYSNQFTDDMMFSVSAYFKDAYNQTGSVWVEVTPQPYYQYSVSEYGNSKGLEFTLRKMATDNIGLTLNYTLAQSEGTSSSPGSNYGAPEDPFTGKTMFPLAEYPMSWDRRHRINAIFDLFWRKGEGPTIAGMHILENTFLNLSGFFQTGTPYTKTDVGGNVIGEINAERQPSIWSVDLRVSRRFMMRDVFGDGAGNTSFEIYFDVNNLLNRTAVAGVYSSTADPDDDGYNFIRKPTDFGSLVYYKDADFAYPSTIASFQYNPYGERMYNEYADTDGDGRVVQYEKYDAFVRYLTNMREFRGNYQAPRTVYFGFMFQF